MTHFFEQRDRWGNGRALWVVLAMIFVTPLAFWSLTTIRLKNDVQNWLPAEDPDSKTLKWSQIYFPGEDRILVSWDDSSLDDPRVDAFARRLAGIPDKNGKLRNGIKQVESVDTPQHVLQRIVKYDVEPDEAIRRLEGVLIGTGNLKVQLTDAGRRRREQTIKALTEQANTELGIEIQVSGPAAESFEADDSEIRNPIEADSASPLLPVTGTWREHDFQVGWRAMHADRQLLQQFRELALALRGRATKEAPDGERLIEDCFFLPGSPVAVSVVLSEAGAADRSGAFQAIRQAAIEVGIEESTLRMGGRPVAGNALNVAVKRAAWNPTAPITQFHKRSVILLSCLVSAVLAFVMLRSFRLATLVLLVAFFTMLVSVSIVPVTGGSMNMVLVVMPTLLLVLTLSAAIHVANYWKHAALGDLQTSVVEAVKMATRPCTLASVTTAIGLMSLCTSPLRPVRDFGLYSALGCLISLVAVLVCLPALLQFWPSKSPRESEVDRETWKTLGRLLSRFRTPVAISCLLVFAVCTLGLRNFRTETKVIRYFPDHTRLVQDYNFLEEKLAGIIPVETIVRFEEDAQADLNFYERMEIVRRIQNKMRNHPEISGTISLADFQPVFEPPKELTGFRRIRWNKRASETERKVKQEGSQSGRFLAVAHAPADLEKQGDRKLSNSGDELWRITAQVAVMSDANYGDLTHDLDEIARSELKLFPGARHVVTGMVPIFLRTQQAVLESLIKSFGLAFGVIAVVMMVVLKNPWAGLLTMLPNLLPVGMVFGLISWCGQRVDIGTMITASVALGIAVDGTLHLLTWFRAGISKGMSRTEAVSHALGHCGPAMWQTSAAVGMGLSMLYFADLLLISRFGWLMAALIAAALIADIIFLPALLAGPLGSLIEKTLPRPHPATADNLDPNRDASQSKPHRQAVPSPSDRMLRID